MRNSPEVPVPPFSDDVKVVFAFLEGQGMDEFKGMKKGKEKSRDRVRNSHRKGFIFA